MGTSERPQEAVAERISEEIAAIHEDSYGSPPKSVSTYLLPDAVLSVVEIVLLKHEELIVGNGAHGRVREVRKAFQEAIGTTFTATVEHMTGRRVIGFISDTHLDPPFSIEFFKLRPAKAPAEGPGDPESG